jgi:hypothetical protein
MKGCMERLYIINGEIQQGPLGLFTRNVYVGIQCLDICNNEKCRVSKVRKYEILRICVRHIYKIVDEGTNNIEKNINSAFFAQT